MTPWLMLELDKPQELPLSNEGFLGVELVEGTTYDQAKALAADVNKKITGISHTSMFPDPDGRPS